MLRFQRKRAADSTLFNAPPARPAGFVARCSGPVAGPVFHRSQVSRRSAKSPTVRLPCPVGSVALGRDEWLGFSFRRVCESGRPTSCSRSWQRPGLPRCCCNRRAGWPSSLSSGHRPLHTSHFMSTPNQKTWRDRLPACFGVVDLKFARHSLDAGRAKEMIRDARDAGASSEDILSAIRDYLTSKQALPEHIDQEILYARKVVG